MLKFELISALSIRKFPWVLSIDLVIVVDFLEEGLLVFVECLSFYKS